MLGIGIKEGWRHWSDKPTSEKKQTRFFVFSSMVPARNHQPLNNSERFGYYHGRIGLITFFLKLIITQSERIYTNKSIVLRFSQYLMNSLTQQPDTLTIHRRKPPIKFEVENAFNGGKIPETLLFSKINKFLFNKLESTRTKKHSN
jgi:hypothetical protein